MLSNQLSCLQPITSQQHHIYSLTEVTVETLKVIIQNPYSSVLARSKSTKLIPLFSSVLKTDLEILESLTSVYL